MKSNENTGTIDIFQKSLDLFSEFKIILATIFVVLICWGSIFLLDDDYKEISIKISVSDTLKLDLGKTHYNILSEEGFTEIDLYSQFINNLSKKKIFFDSISKFNFDEKINSSLYDSFKVIKITDSENESVLASITLLSEKEQLGKEIIIDHILEVHLNTMDNQIEYFRSYKNRNILKIQDFNFKRKLDLINLKQIIDHDIEYMKQKYFYELNNRIGIIKDNIQIAERLNFIENQDLENITVLNNIEEKILSLDYPLDDQLFYLGTRILESVLKDLVAKSSDENQNFNIPADLLAKRNLIKNLNSDESILYDLPSLNLMGYDEILNLQVENRKLEAILNFLDEKRIRAFDNNSNKTGIIVNYNLDDIKVERYGIDLIVSLIITLITGFILGCIIALYRIEYKQRLLAEKSI